MHAFTSRFSKFLPSAHAFMPVLALGVVRGRMPDRFPATHDVLTIRVSRKGRQTVISLQYENSICLWSHLSGSCYRRPRLWRQVVRPAMAVPDRRLSAMSGAAVDTVIADAADDMPCCPSKPALPDCSKDCPLMALCVTAPIHFVSQTGLIVPRYFCDSRFSGRPLRSCEYRPGSSAKTSQSLGSPSSVQPNDGFAAELLLGQRA